MAKKAQRARSHAGEPVSSSLTARRIVWVTVAALWLFLAVSLVSFDSADSPSTVVAVHNDPAQNLCGRVGAYVAWHAYYVIGTGVWALVIGLAGSLAVVAAGRGLTQPVLRGLGALLLAVSISCLHDLIFPDTGPLAPVNAGLAASFIVGELLPRFNAIGTLLILLGGLMIGLVVAADRWVLAVPKYLLTLGDTLRDIDWPHIPNPLRRFHARPALASAGGSASSKRKSRSGGKGGIDPDAGGIGATESFDPEDWEDEEDDDEYEDEDDDEYEDDDEEEDEDEDEEDDDEVDEQPIRRKLTKEELKAKISRLPVRMAGRNVTIAREEDIPRQENFEGYQFPTLDMLEEPETNYSEKMEAFVRNQAQVLEEALQTYGIDAEVTGIESGPVVTLYSVQLAPGTKVAKINAISRDIARALRAQNIRIVPNMVGKTTIGIEVPNINKERVRLKELMSGGHAQGMNLPMFLGKDASGEPLVADLTTMPHMLIAGTTGSGKSVCMNTIIVSWLYTKRPDELKMVLVDPKMVELSQFADIPHLMCPVVTESARAAAILEWAVNKMEERYELLREARVRDVASYNKLTEQELYELFEPQNDLEKAKIPKKLPYMVFVVDELADLMMTAKEAEHSIVRIAQKARAVGIHLILATQRPQANVVTGLIKSNMPCRVSFKVASGMDSRIVLDQKGAELLLGQGDMMYLSPHTSEVLRAQGTLVSDGEIRKVTKFLKNVAGPTFERSLIAIRPTGEAREGLDNEQERDPMFDEAVRIMIESGRGSVSLLQRRLAIGYSRASRLVDQMGLAGILGEHKGSVAREVMITLEEWEQMKALEEDLAASDDDFEDEADDGDSGPLIETIERDDEAIPENR